MCCKFAHLMSLVNSALVEKKKRKEKKKKGGGAVNPGQVVMTTWPTGNVMVSDPFL